MVIAKGGAVTPMPRVTYLFDPLCGWCYGASPVLERIAAEAAILLDLAPAGLFSDGGARVMDRRFAAFAWENDQRIASLTGQTFSEAYRSKVLGTEGGLFDSGPATLALTAVRLTAPEREFEALEAIQRARYVEGRDNTDYAVLADVLNQSGLGEAARRLTAPDETLLNANRARIDQARTDMQAYGLRGVPALLVGEGERRRPMRADALFQNASDLIAELEAL
jgi:putative protein-disulfide isomerase